MVVKEFTRADFDQFISTLKYPPNPFQREILESIAFGSGNIQVSAVAGSGKTTMIEMIVKLVRYMEKANEGSAIKVFAMAFNVTIREELSKRLSPYNVNVDNSNRLGNSVIKKHLEDAGEKAQKIDPNKYQDLASRVLNEVIGRNYETVERDDDGQPVMKSTWSLKLGIASLAEKCLTSFVQPDNIDAMWWLADHHSFDFKGAIPEVETQVIEEVLPKLLRDGKRLWEEHRIISLSEQLALPVSNHMVFPKYDLVLVDEGQDLNIAQQAIAKRCIAEGGRIVIVGDSRQAIMGFSGADDAAWWRMQKVYDTKLYALNITYRCPTKVADLARAIVPQLEARPDAPEGTIRQNISKLDFYELLKPDTLILSRMNKDLVETFFELVKEKSQRNDGLTIQVIGRDISNALTEILKRIEKLHGFKYEDFELYVDRYVQLEEERIKKLRSETKREEQRDTLQDEIATLLTCYDNFSSPTLADFKSKISSVFGGTEEDEAQRKKDLHSVVSLCTVHKSKGLEAERIIILAPEKMPLEREGQRAWQLVQEMNLLYVAITRSLKDLMVIEGGLNVSPVAYDAEVAASATSNEQRFAALALDNDGIPGVNVNKILGIVGSLIEDDEEAFEPAPENKVYFGFDNSEVDEDYEMEEAERPSALTLAEQADNGQALLELNEQAEEAPTLSLEDAAATLYAPVQIADFVEEAAGTPIPPREFFIYGTARPAMYGACPDDYVKDRSQVVAALENCDKSFYVDMVVYPRKLTREEMKRYEIQPISENTWDVQIGEQVFTTGRIEFTVMEHLKNGKVVVQCEVDGRKVSEIEHQWDLTPAKALATELAPKPLSLGDLVLLNPELPTDKGWHNRAVKVATMLQEAGLWDGKSFIRFDNAYETHKRVIGFEHLSLDKLVLSEKDGELLVSLPAENSPEGEKLAEAAPVVKEETALTEPADKSLWAKWILSQKGRVVILDTETTDMQTNPGNFEMVQLGVINLDGEEVLNRYIRPYVSRITEGAANVHGITNAVLNERGAISLISQYADVKAALTGKIIVAYNSPFDKAALENSLKLCGLDPIEIHSWHDAMRLYTKHNPNKLDRGGRKNTNWKLTEAVAQQGLAVDENAHDALADVRMTLALIKSMAADEPNRWKPAKEAATAEPVYKVDDEVLVKSTKRVAIIKKVMGNGELNLEDKEDGSRMTVRSGMVEPYAKSVEVETVVVPQPETEEESDSRLDIRSMDLSGRHVRLEDGKEALVIEVNGKGLTVQPEGEGSAIKVSRDKLFSVITTEAEPEPATPTIVEVISPRQANPYTSLESLVKAFGSREAVKEAIELIQSIAEEIYPENA
jgi:DNA helicase-2/ATP-dependent DNA helicase PcrA